MLKSLLIANRGEIACRVIRTARRLGIRTVAVFSDADAGALHMLEADEAVRIGPPPVRESYLDGARLVQAARETGAEAIHPGYGFLSENADFAQAVIDAGLVWVGPRPASIRAMGLKDAAKRLMQDAGVPTTPGYLGDDQNADRLQQEADAIGYPVLIKAVAGGGGKGMRRVESTGAFKAALASCRREAKASFGDDRVLIERYIMRPRHIEVQVFGDAHGNIVHLFERDCSLQRRHQKVIEEAPAPGMDETTREAICAAAVQAARAVNYVGAGTIEFIADASQGLRADRIWFMEMNTRLQVEHPVTEAITGQDLVEWQLRVASGEALPRRQHELRVNGWALEARLYAEDPIKGFLPSIGRLGLFRLPDAGIRIETGVREGDMVTPFYDPMIAKLIASGATRQEAAIQLAEGIGAIAIWPVKTNAAFLARALCHADFLAGAIDTSFIDRHADTLVPTGVPTPTMLEAAARALIGRLTPASLAPLVGFRLNRHTNRTVRLGIDGHSHIVDLDTQPAPDGIQIHPLDAGFIISGGGESFLVGDDRIDSRIGAVASDGMVIAPMPGRLIAVPVEAGDVVIKGQTLAILEAMKMEYTLSAPFDGTVQELAARTGALVAEGTTLMQIGKSVP